MSFTIEDTKAKVISIIADKLNMPKESIMPGSAFKDLGADSLDIVEMIMNFEETFGIEIDDVKAANITSIGQAANEIALLLAAKSS